MVLHFFHILLVSVKHPELLGISGSGDTCLQLRYVRDEVVSASPQTAKS